MSTPIYDQNLFSREALTNPLLHYRAIRNLGPLVKIKRPRLPVLSRYDDVKNALKASDTLLSGHGLALNPIGNLLGRFGDKTAPNSDGELHQKYRRQLLMPLMPAELEALRPSFEQLISEKVRNLLNKDTFDAAAELSSCLPVEAVSKLMGIPEDGRQNIMLWATSNFNTIGPMNWGLIKDLKRMLDSQAYFRGLQREELAPEGWAAKLYQSIDAGTISEKEAGHVVVGLVLPSLDTTILVANNMLLELGRNPDEWQKLKSNPELIDSTVLEGLRHGGPLRWFTRKACKDYEAGDVFLKKGQRVVIMYGSANRDERKYPEPDKFRVDRNPRDHLGLGHGAHSCIGQHLAKLELTALLKALVEQVDNIEVDEPSPFENFALYGHRTVPMRITG